MIISSRESLYLPDGSNTLLTISHWNNVQTAECLEISFSSSSVLYNCCIRVYVILGNFKRKTKYRSRAQTPFIIESSPWPLVAYISDCDPNRTAQQYTGRMFNSLFSFFHSLSVCVCVSNSHYRRRRAMVAWVYRRAYFSWLIQSSFVFFFLRFLVLLLLLLVVVMTFVSFPYYVRNEKRKRNNNLME